MQYRKMACALVGIGLMSVGVARAATEIQWWHSMTGELGDRLSEIASGFNNSQNDWKVVPIYKGDYATSMAAAIEAFRAGTPPSIVQVPEAGTATMMAARGAVKPVYEMMREAGETLDPKDFVPVVAGYHNTDSQGNMLSMPFNSSTPVFFINKNAFALAGLDPETAPKTWKDFAATAAKLKATGQGCVYTTGWPSWVHIENFSAWHNLPVGTKENGIAGMATRFTFDSPAHVKHVEMLVDFAKKGWFTYAGRRDQAEARFLSGECAMITSSSAALGNVRKNAKFDFSVNFLPYHDDISREPQNSIVGGATLWVLSQKDGSIYKGIARFFSYLSSVDVQVSWHQSTGYVPITSAAYEKARQSGYYEKFPGADVAIRQLNNKMPTENSRGLRFGNFVQGREIIEEELEAAFAGKKAARAALNDAVRRGNEILSKFEEANK